MLKVLMKIISSHRCLPLIVLCLFFNASWADKTLKIVTDPWPPYAYLEQGKAVGIDVDTALAVLNRMGYIANIEMLPWKRCLALVKNLQADAILSASVTEERKSFLYFPEEPISRGDTVFFKRKNDDIDVRQLADLQGLRVGAMLGYKYCQELDESPYFARASRVPNLEQNFNMLINDRIDLVVEVDTVGMYKAKEMGVIDDISLIDNARYCTSKNHLAFSTKLEYELLASKFSEELIKFKATQEYRNILIKYGLD